MTRFRTLTLAAAVVAALGTAGSVAAAGYSPFGPTQPQFERIASFPSISTRT